MYGLENRAGGTFPPFRGFAPDEEWIRSVAGRGWIAVTRDRNIRYRTHEMNSIRDSAARVIVIRM